MSEVNVPLSFSDAAAKRVKALIAEEENPSLMLRVYITGGGCSGFQYGLLSMKPSTKVTPKLRIAASFWWLIL